MFLGFNLWRECCSVMQNMTQKLVRTSQRNRGINMKNRVCTRNEFCGSVDIVPCGRICGVLDLDPDIRKSRNA